MSTILTPLHELRRRAGKSQEDMAAALYITRSAYSKLERGHTELTVRRACQIAQFLKIPVGELLPLPTPNPAEVGTPAAELLYLRAAAEHSVLDAYIQAGMNYQEDIPFDELDENCWIYLDICEIKTREEYEAAGTLITRPAAGGEQAAFEQILRDPGIYALFEHGIVCEKFLLSFWQDFQAKATPYFEFEDKPFGVVTKRLLSDDSEPSATATMISSWPDPLLFGSDDANNELENDIEEHPEELRRPMYQPGTPFEDFLEEFRAYTAAAHAQYIAKYTPEEIQEQISKLPPVNWTEISQDSDARHLAWELEELVFQDSHPAFAYLRDDPAEYARTLARLVGLAWVVESTSERQTAIDVMQEEANRLTGAAYSDEFQAACELFASKHRDYYRNFGNRSASPPAAPFDESDELQGETQEFWTVMQQRSSADHISWALEETVFHDNEPAFARLRNNPAEYARTLVRLIGMVWVTGMSADNIVGEEKHRLEGLGCSPELQAYCNEVAGRLRGANR